MRHENRYLTQTILVLLLAMAAICVFGAKAQGPAALYNKQQAAVLTSFEYGQQGTTQTANSANQIQVSPAWIPYTVSFSGMSVYVGTADASNRYSWGIYTPGGVAICHTPAAALAATNGVDHASCVEGAVSVSPGQYYFAFTANATTGTIGYGTANTITNLSSPTSSTTSSSGQIPATIAIPSAGQRTSGYAQPVFLLN